MLLDTSQLYCRLILVSGVLSARAFDDFAVHLETKPLNCRVAPILEVARCHAHTALYVRTRYLWRGAGSVVEHSLFLADTSTVADSGRVLHSVAVEAVESAERSLLQGMLGDVVYPALPSGHGPAEFPPTPARTKPKRRCRVCYRRRVRKETRYYCRGCDGQPGLCYPDCFVFYHSRHGKPLPQSDWASYSAGVPSTLAASLMASPTTSQASSQPSPLRLTRDSGSQGNGRNY